jgi:hypothetical protein
MEKAFDKVDHSYLLEILDKLNLGTFITKIIKTIYNDIHQIVETPKGQTNKIQIQRGIRQGCSLSMTLFSLAIEPFLQYINSNIIGLKYMKDKYIKTLAYADDTVVCLKDNEDKDKLNKIVKT